MIKGLDEFVQATLLEALDVVFDWLIAWKQILIKVKFVAAT